MPYRSLQLIVAAFSQRAGASRALDAVLRARASVPAGIPDTAAVARSPGGELLLQRAADRVPGGFAVSTLLGEVFGMLEAAGAHPPVSEHPGAPGEWGRTARVLEERLREIAGLLTPATSVLVTIVAPEGAAEVVGVVLAEASKLAVEDLSLGIVCAMADEPALLFAGEADAAVLRGTLAIPHPGLAVFVISLEEPQPLE
jgi:hypothetical protein